MSLNFQQSLNEYNTNINIFETARFKIERTLVLNRLNILDNKIELSCLNLSIDYFEIICNNGVSLDWNYGMCTVCKIVLLLISSKSNTVYSLVTNMHLPSSFAGWL